VPAALQDRGHRPSLATDLTPRPKRLAAAFRVPGQARASGAAVVRCGNAFDLAAPNPSLNTRPSAACQLAREALTVYAAPRGQAGPPLRSR